MAAELGKYGIRLNKKNLCRRRTQFIPIIKIHFRKGARLTKMSFIFQYYHNTVIEKRLNLVMISSVNTNTKIQQ